ncbi:unnamed protein product [Sphagnum balticum]
MSSRPKRVRDDNEDGSTGGDDFNGEQSTSSNGASKPSGRQLTLLDMMNNPRSNNNNGSRERPPKRQMASSSSSSSSSSLLSVRPDPSLYHNIRKHRFEYNVSADEFAHLDYSVTDSVMDIYETFVPTAARQRGIAAKLCDSAFQYAKDHSLRVIPSCSYVSEQYLKLNPDKLSLTKARPQSINIRAATTLPQHHVPLPHHSLFTKHWQNLAAIFRAFKSPHNTDDPHALTSLYAAITHNSSEAPLRREGLVYFIHTIMSHTERQSFYTRTLPFMIECILNLPILLPTASLPLLRTNHSQTIRLSRIQVTALTAASFFSMHAEHKGEHRYGTANMNGLFISIGRRARKLNNNKNNINFNDIILGLTEIEKLRCILHYFTIMQQRQQIGQDAILNEILVYHRRALHIHRSDLLTRLIDTNATNATNTSADTSSGAGGGGEGHRLLSSMTLFNTPHTIEDDDFTYKTIQIDFANKHIGGGVVYMGCIQEEIRMVVSTELLISLLFSEVMDENEAIVMNNMERFCNYTGYSDSFKFNGGYTDELNTSNDSNSKSSNAQSTRTSQRRTDCVVAIDAIKYRRSIAQYDLPMIVRELYKAYAGFSVPLSVLTDTDTQLNGVTVSAVADEDVPADDNQLVADTDPFSRDGCDYSHVSTGNWGCGAFNGDVCMKALIQLVAATLSGRHIRYFSFGESVHSLLEQTMELCVEANVTVAQLWLWIKMYARLKRLHSQQRASKTARSTGISEQSDGASIEANVALYVLRQCEMLLDGKQVDNDEAEAAESRPILRGDSDGWMKVDSNEIEEEVAVDLETISNDIFEA